MTIPRSWSICDELRTYLPAGLIVIPSNFSDLTTHAESYQKAGTAVVCVDRSPRDWNGDTVTVANEEGAYYATGYLIQLGHRRVATISGPLHLTNAQERLAGFMRAVWEAKLGMGPNILLKLVSTGGEDMPRQAFSCVCFHARPPFSHRTT